MTIVSFFRMDRWFVQSFSKRFSSLRHNVNATLRRSTFYLSAANTTRIPLPPKPLQILRNRR